MTKLTTERLEQYAHDKHMCNINDEIREMALQLIAYEQAAKDEVALPEALKYAEIYGRAFMCVDRSGSVHAVDPSQITLTILNEPAPVLPKQPESRNEIMAKGVEAFAKDWKGSARYSRISEMACNFAAKLRNGDADEC